MHPPSLPLTVDYDSTREAHARQYALLFGDIVPRIRKHYFESAVIYLPSFLLGLYAALRAEASAVFFIIAALGIAITLQMRREYKVEMWRMESWFDRGAGIERRLVFNERGMTEHDREVESFCPWSACKNYWLNDEGMFILLANEHWAVIPKTSVKGGITLEQIEMILIARGVTKRG